jgi:hypothetical protein
MKLQSFCNQLHSLGAWLTKSMAGRVAHSSSECPGRRAFRRLAWEPDFGLEWKGTTFVVPQALP